MGMHTGEPVLSDEGRYHGMGVHRAARIMAAGHGGQILASQSTASVLADDLDGISLRDLGEHNLKDLVRPERLFCHRGPRPRPRRRARQVLRVCDQPRDRAVLDLLEER
jgi:class 3 adenylate cyclase